MSKFDECFSDVVHFSNGSIVTSGKISKYFAGKLFAKYTGEAFNAFFSQNVEKDFVRFGFAPENIEDLAGEACWYSGVKESRGAMPVWVYFPKSNKL